MRYRPLTGDVLTAKILNGKPSFVKGTTRKRGAKGMGLRYEKRVHRHFLSLYDGYMPGPWFQYTTSDQPSRVNYAQPDGILVDIPSGQITIVEIKYNHCVEAYFQLMDKYLPIVRKFFNNEDLWRFATVEVCNWYDCAVAFPTHVKLRETLGAVRPNEFAVHVCRP